jgi:cysteine desulfurase/selenocysteine lyase
MFDINAVRKLFPHTKATVYFNAASTGPLSTPAYRLQDDAFREVQMAKVGNQAEVFAALDRIRRHGARIFGGAVSGVGFGFNTTFGLNLAAFGLPLKSGDEVILCDVEFPANVYPWLELRRRGVKVTFIKSRDGFFGLDDLEKAVSRRTRVVSLSFVQFFNGFKPDIDAIAEFCRRRGIWLVLDAIQGAGCEPMQVRKWGVAVASAGAQKWLVSSQGTGLFYIADEIKEILVPPWRSWLGVDWKCRWSDLRDFGKAFGPSARQYELGTYPGALVMGLDWALEYITGLGIRNIQKHNHALLDMLIGYLAAEPYFRITSSLERKHRSSILCFTTDHGDIQAMHRFLLKRKIITAMREGSIRVSAHFYNNERDMQTLIAALDEAARKRFRG